MLLLIVVVMNISLQWKITPRDLVCNLSKVATFYINANFVVILVRQFQRTHILKVSFNMIIKWQMINASNVLF